MSPKNAIKMINIQKSYSVHIVSIWSHQSSSVQFGPIGSYLVHFVHYSCIQSNYPFSPYWLYSVHICPILSTSVLFRIFCPLCSYTVHSAYLGSVCSHSVHIGSIRSILSTLFHFSPIQVIRSTLVLFGPLGLLSSYSVYISPIQSTSVWFGPVQSIMSTSVLFGPSCSYSVHLVLLSPFDPLCSIWSNSVNSVHFGLFQSIVVHLHNGKRHIWVENT